MILGTYLFLYVYTLILLHVFVDMLTSEQYVLSVLLLEVMLLPWYLHRACCKSLLVCYMDLDALPDSLVAITHIG